MFPMMSAPFSCHLLAQPAQDTASGLMPHLSCQVTYRPSSKLMIPPAPMMMMMHCHPSQLLPHLPRLQCLWPATKHHLLLQSLVLHLLPHRWLHPLWFYLNHLKHVNRLDA